MYSKDLGMRPLISYSGMSLDNVKHTLSSPLMLTLGPCIEKVLPAPVYPYAKIDPL